MFSHPIPILAILSFEGVHTQEITWQLTCQNGNGQAALETLLKNGLTGPCKAAVISLPLLEFPLGRLHVAYSKLLNHCSCPQPHELLQDEATRDFIQPYKNFRYCCPISCWSSNYQICLSTVTQLREQGRVVYRGMCVTGRWGKSQVHHIMVWKEYGS